MRPRSSGRIVQLSILAVLFAMSCGGGSCGGGGCGGCGSETAYEFPLNDPSRPDAIVQDEAARARITQGFLDFIKPQLPAVIASQLGSQGGGIWIDADRVVHIPIPDTDLFDIGVAEARMRNAEALLWLDDLDRTLDIQFEPPSNVHLTITNIRLGVQLDLKEDALGSTSSCPVEGDLGPFGPGPLRHAAELSIDAVIDPGVGPDPDRALDIRVTVNDVAINDLDVHVPGSSVYCAEPECQDCAVEVFGSCIDPGGRCVECDIFCGGITDGLLSLATALIDLVRPLINRILLPVVEGMLGNVLNNLNGASAKLQQQVALSDLVPLDAFKASNPFGVFVAPRPGRFDVVDRGTGNGMEITVTGGAEAEIADCVGDLEDFIPVRGPVPVLGGTDSRGRPYHVGFTLAQSMVNQILYALHRSGSLCIKMRTEDVRDLTNGQFTLNASLLSLLAADIGKLASDRAPVILELKPRNAPTMTLGSGQRTGQDAMGNDVYDWLMKLELNELGIAFHVFIQDRYVRVFEVTTDIHVGMNINVLPDNRLEVAIGELRIDNFNQYFNEILPNADFAMVLPTLIELVMQSLLSNALTFDVDISTAVSDALNGAPIYLRVNDIFRDGVQQDFLTMSLTFTSSLAAPLSLGAETYASLDRDDALLLRDHDDVPANPSGRVRLRVGEDLPYELQQAMEYQVRVDRGLWRVWRPARPDGTILVEDGHLLVPGEHEIEVRARYKEDYQTLDATPASVLALVDPIAPVLTAELAGEVVVARVVDAHTPRSEPLRLEARARGGDWFEVPLTRIDDEHGTCVGEVQLAAIAGPKLELRAFDPRGNPSRIASVSLGLAAEVPEAQPGAGGCACHDAGGSPHDHGTPWIVLLGAVIALALLRRSRAR